MGVDIKKLTEWLDPLVGRYSEELHPKYKEYADILRSILTRLKDDVLPDGFIQAREKKVASFAAKCVKYYATVGNPLEEFNDLCGGRIIVHTLAEVKQLAALCRQIFEVNEPLSRNVSDDLRAREFGYGSDHLIVRLDEKKMREHGIFEQLKDIKPANVKKLAGLKAEIQLRTVAQHAWADFEHDISYKSEFEVPRTSQRKSGRVAAMVETIDHTLSEISDEVSLLRTNAGVYRSPSEAKDEIARLTVILQHDSQNARMAYRIVRLQMTRGEFTEAIKIADSFTGKKDRRFKALRGYVQCLLHSSNPKSREYKEGRQQIEEAAKEQEILDTGRRDSEILCWLAETAWDEPDAKVAKRWERAYATDPRNPRALAGHLRYVQPGGQEQMLSVAQPDIDSAMELCREHVSAEVNLPYSLYNLAEFYLLKSGEIATREEKQHAYLATYMLTRAVSVSHNRRFLEDALAAMTRLKENDRHLIAAEWCRLTLLLALSVRPANGKTEIEPELLATPDLAINAKQPVLIIAGGCDPRHEETMDLYRAHLEYALNDFNGTVICGGTKQGISGIIGKVLGSNRDRLTGIAYLPEELPRTGSASEDTRYQFRPRTPGVGFSPIQPIQGWIDLLAAKVNPKEVKLLGVNGGKIAGFEYHLAAMLGAEVGIIDQSGGIADELILRHDEPGNQDIQFLPNDRDVLRVFVGGPRPHSLTEAEIEKLADQVRHDFEQKKKDQLTEQRKLLAKERPDLHLIYSGSNRGQVVDIEAKLTRLGLRIEHVRPGTEIKLHSFTNDEVEALAKQEHARYVLERIRKGFRPGPRDDANNRNPTLVAWDALPPSEKEKDFNAVRRIPEYLRSIDCKIVKK